MENKYCMLNKEAYAKYLVSTRRNEKAVNESMNQFENFQQFISNARLKELSELSKDVINAYIRPDKPTNRRGEIEKANKFMIDYATSIEKGFVCADEHEYKHIASEIRGYYKKQFENTAKGYVTRRMEQLLTLPDDFEVNPEILYGLTNEQFVTAFKALHRLVKEVYNDIPQIPSKISAYKTT